LKVSKVIFSTYHLLLNSILSSLTCALRAQVNMTQTKRDSRTKIKNTKIYRDNLSI